MLAVRPDPRAIAAMRARARRGRTEPDDGGAEAAPLRELLGRQGVIPALIAAQASFAVMVGVMTLTGAVVVDHYHHAAHHVFPIIGAHVVGMYALVIVVGDLIDRIGRTPSLAGGLLLMAGSVISLLWIESVPATAAALFGLGARVEPLVRRGDGGARRPHRAVGARQAARLQRPALGADRRGARARRRRGADRARRRGARDRRRGARDRARAVDPAARARRRVTWAGADRWVSMTRSSIAALATIAATVVAARRSPPRRRSRSRPSSAPHSRVVTYDRGVVHVTRLTMSVTRSAGRLHARVDLAATNESSRVLHRVLRIGRCTGGAPAAPVCPAAATIRVTLAPGASREYVRRVTLRQPPARPDAIQAALVAPSAREPYAFHSDGLLLLKGDAWRGTGAGRDYGVRLAAGTAARRLNFDVPLIARDQAYIDVKWTGTAAPAGVPTAMSRCVGTACTPTALPPALRRSGPASSATASTSPAAGRTRSA